MDEYRQLPSSQHPARGRLLINVYLTQSPMCTPVCGVSIRRQVDREERPDVDQCFMTFVQATSGGGGWPMSVWLTPDLKPFVGATYFPELRFIGVLKTLAEKWSSDR